VGEGAAAEVVDEQVAAARQPVARRVLAKKRRNLKPFGAFS
jgi:hypothetical protein